MEQFRAMHVCFGRAVRKDLTGLIGIQWVSGCAVDIVIFLQVHWKTQSATSASLAIRRWYFHNGFRNVVGGIGIAGYESFHVLVDVPA